MNIILELLVSIKVSYVCFLSCFKVLDEKLTHMLLQFLEKFLDCIPHNIHEECFQILDILLEFCWPYITESGLIMKYITQFVDQFTMKSNA